MTTNPPTTIKNPQVDNWWKKVFDFLFPPRCVCCQKPGALLCPSCHQTLLNQTPPTVCPICSRPAIDGFTHPKCQNKLRTPIDRAVCSFPYSGPASALITHLKYKKARVLVSTITTLLIHDLNERGISLGEESLIIPVPLHPFRKIERGFNQAELIAKPLAEAFHLTYSPQSLARIKNTLPQVSLKKDKRLENIRGAFAVRPEAEPLLKDKDVILVDDVFTTGATLRECGRTLKKAGVRWVYAITFAKR